MKNQLLLAVLALLLTSCAEQNAPTRPPLGIEKVSMVVQELRIMEAAYGMHYQQIDSLKTGWKPFHEEVFKRLAVSKEDFTTSLAYYTLFPDSLLLMDSLIIHRLEPLSGERLNKRVPGQKHIPHYQPKVNQEGGK